MLTLKFSSLILALHEALCLFSLVCFCCEYHTEAQCWEHRTLLAGFVLLCLSHSSETSGTTERETIDAHPVKLHRCCLYKCLVFIGSIYLTF